MSIGPCSQQYKNTCSSMGMDQCSFCFYKPGKYGPPYLGKASTAARAALPSPKRASWVFSCFGNPPNSDLDHKIFNVSTSSF